MAKSKTQHVRCAMALALHNQAKKNADFANNAEYKKLVGMLQNDGSEEVQKALSEGVGMFHTVKETMYHDDPTAVFQTFQIDQKK